jgi:threonine/homoserine/homoserine lactone efflux protein
METFLPVLAFVVASTCTPGPNNLMVLASGATFGLGRTLPHIAGIALGFPVMIVAVGIGLGAVFAAAPWLDRTLQYVAFVWLCWLAWRIANAGRPDLQRGSARPLTIIQAAAFQWVNPKAWALVLGGTAVFVTAGDGRVMQIAGLALLFGLVCLPNGVVWALFGRAIAAFLADDTRRRWFNAGMAVLLVASALPELF